MIEKIKMLKISYTLENSIKLESDIKKTNSNSKDVLDVTVRFDTKDNECLISIWFNDMSNARSALSDLKALNAHSSIRVYSLMDQYPNHARPEVIVAFKDHDQLDNALSLLENIEELDPNAKKVINDRYKVFINSQIRAAANPVPADNENKVEISQQKIGLKN